MSQKGIPNAFVQNRKTPDLHSFGKYDSVPASVDYPGVISHGAIAVSTVPVNQISLVPIILPRSLFIKKFAYRVTVSEAGKVLRVGLYANKINTQFPTILIRDFGEFSTGATGAHYTPDLDQFLPGTYLYWIATWTDAATAWFAQLETTKRFGIGGYASAGSVESDPAIGFNFTKVYDGIFPDPFPDYAAGARALPADEKTPAIFLRLHNTI